MFNGLLSVGGLLMFGNIDAILRYNPDFQIDYMEIPGTSISDATPRYSFRLQEQENIWEYYKIISQRLRTRVDNPFSPLSNGVAPDDNSTLYCLREGLVNFLAHADYFSEIHSTVRVFDNHILLQNPGAFPVNLDIVGRTIVSQPRNPNLLRFFKLAKLSENGGYGIDKILNWSKLTGCEVTINSDITKSEVDFMLPINANQRQSTPNNFNDVEMTLLERVLALIKNDKKISISQIAERIGQSKRSVDRIIEGLKRDGRLQRLGTPRSGEWKLL